MDNSIETQDLDQHIGVGMGCNELHYNLFFIITYSYYSH
jgi:hypothetical protein